MTQRHTLEQHRQQLGEAQEIMESMKSLAFMEMRKLEQHADLQRDLVSTLEQTATDFLHFHPSFRRLSPSNQTAYLLLGSERGFCGAFNGHVLERLNNEPDAAKAPIIACGHKLHSRLETDPRLRVQLDGPSVQDEIPAFLQQLLQQIIHLQQQGPLSIRVISQAPGEQQAQVETLLPPFQHLSHSSPPDATAPLLHLPPQDFFAELVQHYLFANLHERVCRSLQAENHYRMLHLDGAIRYLRERLDRMRLKSNQLRKEEITEEIEVILLSAEALRPGS